MRLGQLFPQVSLTSAPQARGEGSVGEFEPLKWQVLTLLEITSGTPARGTVGTGYGQPFSLTWWDNSLIALQTFILQTGSVGETCETGRAGCSELALCELLFPANRREKIGFLEGIFIELIDGASTTARGASDGDFLCSADQYGDDGWVRRVYEAR